VQLAERVALAFALFRGALFNGGLDKWMNYGGCGEYDSRKGPKKKRKKTGVPTYLPFLRFFEISRSDLENIFMVFLGSSCRETAKNAIKTNR
jgi:hypothetical protein